MLGEAVEGTPPLCRKVLLLIVSVGLVRMLGEFAGGGKVEGSSGSCHDKMWISIGLRYETERRSVGEGVGD